MFSYLCVGLIINIYNAAADMANNSESLVVFADHFTAVIALGRMCESVSVCPDEMTFDLHIWHAGSSSNVKVIGQSSRS